MHQFVPLIHIFGNPHARDHGDGPFNIVGISFSFSRSAPRSACWAAAMVCGGFAHGRAFAAIAIPAATKHRNNFSLSHFARSAQHIQQRVVAVRVINDHCEITIMLDAFKTSRRAGALFAALRDDLEFVT